MKLQPVGDRERGGKKRVSLNLQLPALNTINPSLKNSHEKKKSMEIGVETTDVLNTSEGANT